MKILLGRLNKATIPQEHIKPNSQNVCPVEWFFNNTQKQLHSFQGCLCSVHLRQYNSSLQYGILLKYHLKFLIHLGATR